MARNGKQINCRLIQRCRDVASAFVLAMEQQRISGRYLLAHRPLSLQDILVCVHEVNANYPTLYVSMTAVWIVAGVPEY